MFVVTLIRLYMYLYNYLRKDLLATAGNLKVNEQTKYKSVPIFLLFLAVERKPEIRNY